MAKLSDVFTDARDAGCPLVAVRTSDQIAAIETLCTTVPNTATDQEGTHPVPKVRWDAVLGVMGINDAGKKWLKTIDTNPDVPLSQRSTNPQTALEIAGEMPKYGLFFMVNAHRWIADAFVSTGVLNLREPMKANGRTFVLIAPTFDLPVELRQDVVVLDDPLPEDAELRAVVEKLTSSQGCPTTPDSIDKAVDALRGLSPFAAETVTAMSMRKAGIDHEALWERKRAAVEQTRGLKLQLTGTRFSDTGGNAQLLADMRDLMEDDYETPAAIVWWDEFEKTGAAGSYAENSVDRDFRGRFLTWMETSKHGGVILVGMAGTGKSLAAQSIGPEFGKPTFIMDPGDMKGPLVGNSEQYVREALKTMDATAKGRLFVVATCNKLDDIAPEIRRRFTSGIYYVDLPTADERRAIARIHLKAFGLSLDLVEPLVAMTHDWTGAEIRNLCRVARRPAAQRSGDALAYAATKVVPVSVSSPKQLTALRQLADGAFLSANYPGTYTIAGPSAPPTGTRKVAVRES